MTKIIDKIKVQLGVRVVNVEDLEARIEELELGYNNLLTVFVSHLQGFPNATATADDRDLKAAADQAMILLGYSEEYI